jgi:hypothetical protein
MPILDQNLYHYDRSGRASSAYQSKSDLLKTNINTMKENSYL